MVAWDEKEFDKQGDAAHRKYVADSFTATEIATAAMTLNGLGMDEVATGHEVSRLIAQAVRMARGEEEIR